MGIFGLLSLCQSTPGIILYILETIILYQIGVSYCGFRFIPVYGEYYFYNSTLPNRQKLNIIHTILLPLSTVLTIYCIYALYAAIEHGLFYEKPDFAESTFYIAIILLAIFDTPHV